MPATIDAVILSLEAVWPAGVVWVLAKATLLLIAAFVLSVALRGAAAAVRHLVWSATLVALLLFPLLMVAVPAWSIPGLGWGGKDVRAAAPIAPLATARIESPADAALAPGAPVVFREVGIPPHEAGVTGTAPRVAAAEASTAPAAPVRWAMWMLALWAAGVLAVLGWLALGYLRMMRLVRNTVRLTDPEWLQSASVLADALGIRRPVTLLHGDRSMMPVTCGVVWPVILVPPAAEEWNPERRRAVLLHELAHIRRQDCLTQLLAQLCCALFWFHPAVWFAARQMRIERERACDDVVLCFGTRASDYAGFLLDVARAFRGSPLAAPAAVSMARPGQLEGRLLAVLDARRPRAVPARQLSVLAAVAALLVVVPLAALEPSAAATGRLADRSAAMDARRPGAMMIQEEGTHAAAETLAGDDFRWSGRLRPGATLAIHNLSGDIRAVPAAGPDAEVRAEKHVRHGDPESIRIERVEYEGGVTFCVLMPTEREGGNDCTATGIEHRNVDSRATRADVHFTVAVPAGVNLRASALSGSIEGERLPGDVDAVTLSGSVRVSAAGSVQATTLSGTLDVAMGRTAWDGTLALRNMSGTIRVRLPDNASTEVRASSMSGSIRSDFPLEVGRRSAQGTIGTGGRRLELQTMSGAIRLEREGAAGTAGTTAEAEARRLDFEEEWELGLEESVSGFGAWLGREVGQAVAGALQEVGSTLGSLGSSGSPRAMHDYPTGELITILRGDPDAELRRIAAWRLADRGRAALTPLDQALRSDADAGVREMAAWSLAQIGDRAAAPALQYAVRSDAAEDVRWSALLSLGELGAGSLAPVVAAAAADRSTRIRKRTAWTMGDDHRSADLAALQRALRDTDPEVRSVAAWAAGNLADARLVGALAPALDDSQPNVRRAALWALTQIDDAAAREAVRQATRSGDARIRQLALGAIRGDPWPWPWPWPVPRPRPSP